jgi:hypothetical protein
MFGGAVMGGKALGCYPSDFIKSKTGMIPETPWDTMWFGIKEWFGIPTNKVLKNLPMHKNFPPMMRYNKTEPFDSHFVR